MLGDLNTDEIEGLLERQATGRLGCYADGKTYIVPINYAYKNGYIYGHSSEGKKIEMLRKNPQVCFQVDKIDSIVEWKSVIAWGKYEQITDGAEMQKAMQEIIQHIMPLIAPADGYPSHGITDAASDIGSGVELILYKIFLIEKSGKFEIP